MSMPRRLLLKTNRLTGSGKIEYLVINTSFYEEGGNYTQSIYKRHTVGHNNDWQRLYQCFIDDDETLSKVLAVIN